jgi:hypothetical protein
MNIQVPWIYIINNKKLIKNGNEKYLENNFDSVLQDKIKNKKIADGQFEKV